MSEFSDTVKLVEENPPSAAAHLSSREVSMDTKSIEQAKAAMELAQILHKAVPEGTAGGTVITALSILIGAGINYAPEAIRDGLVELSAGVVRSIISGETDIRFEL